MELFCVLWNMPTILFFHCNIKKNNKMSRSNDDSLSHSSERGSSTASVPSVINEIEIHNDTMPTDPKEDRIMNLKRVYAEKIVERSSKDTERMLKRVLRTSIIPQVKFVYDGKAFGSYHKPDFTNEGCWQSVLFDQIETMKNVSDGKKAKIWMTYCKSLKQEFSNARGRVMTEMRKAFMMSKF